MKNSFNGLLTDRGILYATILSFCFLLFQISLVGYQYIKLPPVIPIFNSLSWGNERLASSYSVFFIPGILLLLGICNYIFASKFYKRHALLSRMLSYNLLLCAALSTLAVIQILFLVF